MSFNAVAAFYNAPECSWCLVCNLIRFCLHACDVMLCWCLLHLFLEKNNAPIKTDFLICCTLVCVCVCVQILSPLGRISEALGDLTKAIQLQPSARLYRHRGTLLFISEVWPIERTTLCLFLSCFHVLPLSLDLLSGLRGSYGRLSAVFRAEEESAYRHAVQRPHLLPQRNAQSRFLSGLVCFSQYTCENLWPLFSACTPHLRACRAWSKHLFTAHTVFNKCSMLTKYSWQA